MEHEQSQVSVNKFPGLFLSSSKHACGIVISAMVYVRVMVIHEPSVQTNRSVCLIMISFN